MNLIPILNYNIHFKKEKHQHRFILLYNISLSVILYSLVVTACYRFDEKNWLTSLSLPNMIVMAIRGILDLFCKCSSKKLLIINLVFSFIGILVLPSV